MFFKKRKIEINEVIQYLSSNFKYETNGDTIIIEGKYRNEMRDYKFLYCYIEKGMAIFKDGKGRLVTHIPSRVPVSEIEPTVKNILNII